MLTKLVDSLVLDYLFNSLFEVNEKKEEIILESSAPEAGKKVAEENFIEEVEEEEMGRVEEVAADVVPEVRMNEL